MTDENELPDRGEEEFIGDGLYVSFDGWGIRLRAPREGGDHFVVLDPDTYLRLREWVHAYAALSKHMGEP